jgi:hypothetical protein
VLLERRRLLIDGEPPAEPVGQRRRRLRHRADDDREEARACDEAGGLVDEVTVGRQPQRLERGPPRRCELEDRHRLPRRHQCAGELLRELEERPDRPDHEQAVAEEAHELPDGQVTGLDGESAGVHEQDEEAPGGEHTDRLDRGLPHAR